MSEKSCWKGTPAARPPKPAGDSPVLPAAGSRRLSYRHPCPLVYKLPVPHLEHEKYPDHVAVVTRIVRFMLPEEIFDERTAEIASLETPVGEQQIARQFPKPRIRL